MIALKSELERESVYDRPGADEVARLRDQTHRELESMDSPADILAEILARQLANYRGPMPSTGEELRAFVVAQFRSAAGPTAVSAMLEQFVEEDHVTRSANTIRRMLVLVRSQVRPALTCDAIAIAMGIHIGEGRSLDEIAEAHGITKQALSKRTIRVCEELGLPPSVLMRPESARESYRLKQTQRHSAARAAGMGSGSMEELKAKLTAARQRVNGAALRSK